MLFRTSEAIRLWTDALQPEVAAVIEVVVTAKTAWTARLHGPASGASLIVAEYGLAYALINAEDARAEDDVS